MLDKTKLSPGQSWKEADQFSLKTVFTDSWFLHFKWLKTFWIYTLISFPSSSWNLTEGLLRNFMKINFQCALFRLKKYRIWCILLAVPAMLLYLMYCWYTWWNWNPDKTTLTQKMGGFTVLGTPVLIYFPVEFLSILPVMPYYNHTCPMSFPQNTIHAFNHALLSGVINKWNNSSNTSEHPRELDWHLGN